MFRRQTSVAIDLDKYSSESVVRKTVNLLARGYTKAELDLENRTLTLSKKN